MKGDPPWPTPSTSRSTCKSIPEAVERYRKILGAEPAKVRARLREVRDRRPAGDPVAQRRRRARHGQPPRHPLPRAPATSPPSSRAPSTTSSSSFRAGGRDLLLRQGGQVLGARRGRRAVGDVHAARGRRGRAGARSWAHEVPLAERWRRVLCSPMRRDPRGRAGRHAADTRAADRVPTADRRASRRTRRPTARRGSGGQVVGVAGLELHGGDGLLRSVAVTPGDARPPHRREAVRRGRGARVCALGVQASVPADRDRRAVLRASRL